MRNGLALSVVLQVLGVIVLLAEALSPGVGLFTVMALGLFGASLYIAFAQISANAGFVFLIIDIVLIPVLVLIVLKSLAHSPFALRTQMSKADGVTSQSDSLEKLIGKEGVTISMLRPAGIALIDGKRVDVGTSGVFIEKNQPITVIAAEGNQLIVQKKDQ